MNIQEALKSGKKFKRPHMTNWSYQYFYPETGPYKDLVSCDYMVEYLFEDDPQSVERVFSTSLDLYPEDILADDWIFCDQEFNYKTEDNG